MSKPSTTYPFQKATVEQELIRALGSRKVSSSHIDRRIYSRDSIVAYTCTVRFGGGGL